MVQLTPGLGLTNRVIIDQHFQRRGRIGRLMLAGNPARSERALLERLELLVRSWFDQQSQGSGHASRTGSQLFSGSNRIPAASNNW